MGVFEQAYEHMLNNEGRKWSHYKLDPGGETYFGISRVYHPDWPGWGLIDAAHDQGIPLSSVTALPGLVEDFYRANVWNRINGSGIASKSPKIAIRLFDMATNLGNKSAVKRLQRALNLLNKNGKLYLDLVVDGLAGRKTVEALGKFLDQRTLPREEKERIIFNLLDVFQGMHYVKRMEENPENEKYWGWFRRLS